MTTQAPFAVVLENSDDYHVYLNDLSTRVGFRYVVASHTDVFNQLIDMQIAASMFIIRFERQLNHFLKAYMRILSEPQYADIPVLLIANDQTEAQAKTMLERPIDGVMLAPVDPEQMAVKTGAMLRRSMRQSVDVKVWLQLEGRMIEGRTIDVSGTGMSVFISDPILAQKFTLRMLPDSDITDIGIDFSVQVRRKEKVEGGYHLGLSIIEYLAGDLDLLRDACGIQFQL